MTIAGPSTATHDWFVSSATSKASDALLGCILLLAAAFTIWDTGDASFSRWDRLGAGFFPTVVAIAMLAVGALLLARSAFSRRQHPAPWGLRNFAVLVAAILVVVLAAWWSELQWLLYFGPPEHATLTILLLSVLAALARWSRLRAVGMILLGFFLAAVGMDAITGQIRLTMGVESLIDGIPLPFLLLGLVVIADGLVCLFSPPLLLATYAWLGPRLNNVTLPTAMAIGARVVAALAIAASLYFAFIFSAQAKDIGLVLLIGVFGIVSKLFGWNRLALLIASAYSNALEQGIRQSMLLSQGDPSVFWDRPISSGLLLASIGVVVLTIVLVATRGRWRRQASP